MQVPLEWIQELIDIKNVTLEELVEKLTLGGFEVEEILEIEVKNKKQIVLDISATANRSDSLSIQGISSEIASLLNRPLNNCIYTKTILEWKESITNEKQFIEANLGCSTFLALEVENLQDLSVPIWIQEKLISAKINPTNSLLDFQTYILLETGYPLALYDLGKIQKQVSNSKLNFSIENGKPDQKFFASNGLEYKLNESNLLINVNHYPLSIAGIIENKNYTYSETTNSLLIEGSIFNAALIRQHSRNLGLRTDRSARYEKSLKQTYLIESVYRLISLLRIKNPHLTCHVSTFLQETESMLKNITLRYSTIKEILGPIDNLLDKVNFISEQKVSEYLKRLNLEFEYDESQLKWEVQIPNLRSEDITQEIDLIEEVGRLHGFNNFVTTLPKITKIGAEDLSYQTRKKITSCLLNLGLNELIHYSLVGQNHLTNSQTAINLINPLLSDYGNLRTSLLPTLIETVAENLKQSNLTIEGFEYGHVFSGNIPNNPQELEYIAGVYGGTNEKLSWSNSKKVITWFEAKGKIEQLFKQLNIGVYWELELGDSSNNLFHPYRTAQLYLLNGNSLGKFGQIHPAYAHNKGLVLETYLFEFSLKCIQDQLQKNKLPVFRDYSAYPKILKDLSFIISKGITFVELKKLLYLNGTKFLSKVNLLDEYQDSSINADSTSLCVQLVFQSTEKTLENKEIETILIHLQSVLSHKFNAIIRK